MSIKVVSAPKGQAKRHVRGGKPEKQAQPQAVATEDEANVAQQDSTDNGASKQHDSNVAQTEATSETEFTFGGALAEAAASLGSLTAESSAADAAGFGIFGDDDGSGGTVLLLGAIALVALGAVVLLDDGGKKNSAPTITAAAATTAEDTAVTITPTAADPDSDPVTVTATSTNGTVVKNANGSFTFTPTANFNGTAVITFTASDGELSTTATSNVTVTAVNDAPTITAAAVAPINEDSAAGATFTVTAADVDAGNTVTTSATVPAAQGTVSKNADGSFTFKPAANFSGTAVVTVSASDGTATTTQNVNITVNEVNDPATITPSSVTVTEDVAFNLSNVLTVSDVDGSSAAVTVAVTTQPQHGTVTTNATGDVIYTPTANYNGSDSITFTLTDDDGLASTATIAVSVTAVNDLPTITVPNVTTAEDSTGVVLTPTVADVDGDTVNVTATATNGTIAKNANGTFTFVPAADFNGTAVVTFTANDGTGTKTTTANVTVTPVDDVTTVNIDVPPSGAAVVFNASGDDFVFEDAVDERTDVIIKNFAAGDVIHVTGADAVDYNFGTRGTGAFANDLRITFNDGTNFTQIIIEDVIQSGFVFDAQSAADAIGIDNFITFG